MASHRVLCCSTLEGKISIARQLEPGLHIDSHPDTVSADLITLRGGQGRTLSMTGRLSADCSSCVVSVGSTPFV